MGSAALLPTEARGPALELPTEARGPVPEGVRDNCGGGFGEYIT